MRNPGADPSARQLLRGTAVEGGAAIRLTGTTLRTLRPAKHDKIKQAARLGAVQELRRRSALRELDDATDEGAPVGRREPGTVA